MSVADLKAALAVVGNNTIMERREALDTLLIYAQNLAEHPDEARYKRVRINNVHFQERLGEVPGGMAAMRALGYELDHTKQWLVIHDDDDDDDDDEDEDEEGGASNEGQQDGGTANGSTTTGGDGEDGEKKGAADGESKHHDQNGNGSSSTKKDKEGDVERLHQCASMIEEEIVAAGKVWESLPVRTSVESKFGPAFQAAGIEDDQGRRPNMEDDEIIEDHFAGEEGCAYVGLYDGHGGRGTVDFVVKSLHFTLAREMRATNFDMPQAYKSAYVKTDAQVRRANILQSGSTAVSAVIRRLADGKRMLYVANAGDSRAVIARKDAVAERLTVDHKPNLPEERKRIEENGGFVAKNNRVNGVLAISRALGDHMLKTGDVITPRPFCAETEIVEGEDDILIVACDGVWDVVSDQEAVELVRSVYYSACEDKQANEADCTDEERNQACKKAARALIDESLRKRSTDNITVVVIRL